MTAYMRIKQRLQDRMACRPGMKRFSEIARKHRYNVVAALEDTRVRVIRELDRIIAQHGEDSYIPHDVNTDIHPVRRYGSIDARYMAWLMSTVLFRPKEYRYSNLNVHEAGGLRRKLKFWTTQRILRRLGVQ